MTYVMKDGMWAMISPNQGGIFEDTMINFSIRGDGLDTLKGRHVIILRIIICIPSFLYVLFPLPSLSSLSYLRLY